MGVGVEDRSGEFTILADCFLYFLNQGYGFSMYSGSRLLYVYSDPDSEGAIEYLAIFILLT